MSTTSFTCKVAQLSQCIEQSLKAVTSQYTCNVKIVSREEGHFLSGQTFYFEIPEIFSG